jgi:hypothetical protein
VKVIRGHAEKITLKIAPRSEQNAGKRAVFVRAPDGATIEFMQPAPVATPESSGAT